MLSCWFMCRQSFGGDENWISLSVPECSVGLEVEVIQIAEITGLPKERLGNSARAKKTQTFSWNSKLITAKANELIVLLEQRLRVRTRKRSEVRVLVRGYKWKLRIGITKTKTPTVIYRWKLTQLILSRETLPRPPIWNTSAEVGIENHIRWLLERGTWKNFCMYITKLTLMRSSSNRIACFPLVVLSNVWIVVICEGIDFTIGSVYNGSVLCCLCHRCHPLHHFRRVE